MPSETEERDWGWGGFREGIDYPGRPDIGYGYDPDWGCTFAKKFKPYVHSVSSNATLIHKVDRVRIRWYAGNYSYMQRLSVPSITAETVCGMSKLISSPHIGKNRMRAKMCEVPDPNAVLCGVCHGELPTFSRKRKVRIKKRWAKDHLNCKGVRGE